MNDLNVFKYGYDSWSRPANWGHNFANFFRNIKRAWSRATKGYCDWDVWDLDSYFATMMRDAIRALANTTHSYPFRYEEDGHEMTYEEWIQHLNGIADNFDIYLSGMPNKYENDFDKVIRNDPLVSGKEEEIRNKYYQEEKAIFSRRNEAFDRAMEDLNKYKGGLWD